MTFTHLTHPVIDLLQLPISPGDRSDLVRVDGQSLVQHRLFHTGCCTRPTIPLAEITVFNDLTKMPTLLRHSKISKNSRIFRLFKHFEYPLAPFLNSIS